MRLASPSGLAAGFRHFALGPVLWTRAPAAAEKEPDGQSAWERGMTSAVRAYDNPRSSILVLQAVALAVAAVAVGLAVAGSSLPLQIVAAAFAALVAVWAVPLLWAAFATLDAPRRQRNEAHSLVASERRRFDEVLAAERAQHQQAIDRRDAIIKENDDNYRLAFDQKFQENESLRGQLGVAERTIREYESGQRRPPTRPYLVFTGVDNSQASVVTGLLQPTGTSVLVRHVNVQHEFVRVNVANDPPAGAVGAAAEKVVARITFTADDGSMPVHEMLGRWAETPQRMETGRVGISLEEVQLDIEPNGLPHPIDIAMRKPGETSCWAFNDENSTALDLQLPTHELIQPRYLVRVSVRGSNTETVAAEFVLTNEQGSPLRLTGPLPAESEAERGALGAT
jgi:hypothetical protein